MGIKKANLEFFSSWILRHVGRDVFLNYLLFRFFESNILFRTFFPRLRRFLKLIFAKKIEEFEDFNYFTKKFWSLDCSKRKLFSSEEFRFFLLLKNHQNCLSDKFPSLFVSFCFRTSVELHYSRSSKQYRKIICSLFDVLLVTKN